MRNERRVIPLKDYRLLRMMLSRRQEYFIDREAARLLGEKLDRAQVVKTDDVPADVVVMNSTVLLDDLTNDEIATYRLVYPNELSARKTNLSVMAPIGMAILGGREGEIVDWPLPSGVMSMRIIKVRQERKTRQGRPVKYI